MQFFTNREHTKGSYAAENDGKHGKLVLVNFYFSVIALAGEWKKVAV